MEFEDWLAALLMGFFGSVHCVGMCGGMAASIRLTLPDHKTATHYILYYNAGRISSYMILGLVLGFLGGHFYQQLIVSGIDVLRVLAACLLISMGLYLLKLPNLLPMLERVGTFFWRRIQPLTRSLLPIRAGRQAWLLGVLWGFIPCGLVYSAWSLSATQAGAWQGAAVMFAFGLGTLPSMVAVGLIGERVMKVKENKLFQMVSALILIIYGCFVLYQLLSGDHHHGHHHH